MPGRWESLSARKFKPSCSRARWDLNRDLDAPERLGDLGAVFLGPNSLFVLDPDSHDVRDGSISDMAGNSENVRFSSMSGHSSASRECLQMDPTRTSNNPPNCIQKNFGEWSTGNRVRTGVGDSQHRMIRALDSRRAPHGRQNEIAQTSSRNEYALGLVPGRVRPGRRNGGWRAAARNHASLRPLIFFRSRAETHTARSRLVPLHARRTCYVIDR
jgi:hypothetical protein